MIKTNKMNKFIGQDCWCGAATLGMMVLCITTLNLMAFSIIINKNAILSKIADIVMVIVVYAVCHLG
jgi:hypothetical protein